jgi:serine/threonine-protein kinase
MADLPTIEGYRVLRELGSGTISSVYAALEESLGRTVALKVLKPTIAIGSPFAAQLEHEGRVLSMLSHPNVGLLYAFSKTEARMFIALEFVDGHSLGAVVKKSARLPAASTAAVGAAIARGLAHVHERGVVHRDIKPANILVSRRGEVKIFDFGSAQLAGEQPRASAEPVRLEDVASFGTPAYMSPEQVLGEHVDARSDVFSLGVVLYELVTGARPFDRDATTRPAAHRIRREPALPIRRQAPNVPLPLEHAIMRAIEKLPADRFQTAHELAEELDRIVGQLGGVRAEHLVMQGLESAGLPGVEAPKTPGARVERRRTPVRWATAGLAVVFAAILGVGATLQGSAARRGEPDGIAPVDVLPQSPAFIRVVATPWAEIWIDGQRVDVTPFARALPVRPGTHYLSFVHPQAPVEKRTLSLAPGETKTVDVRMAVGEYARPDQPSAQKEREPKR